MKIKIFFSLFVSFVGIFLLLKWFWKPTPTAVLTSVDKSKLEIISSNPTFTYEPIPQEILNDPRKRREFRLPWYTSGGVIFARTEEGSIVIIHPVNLTTPRWIAQNISLPSHEKYVLGAVMGNVADLLKGIRIVDPRFNKTIIIEPCKSTCSDAIIKLKIVDVKSGKETTIYETVVDSRDGWREVFLDISKYAGKEIIFKAEGYAGGPCADWCGEWAAIRELYIAEWRG